MAEATRTGLLDLEKELTCANTADLHRGPLSTSQPPRLSPHILWLMPQVVVLVAGVESNFFHLQSIQLPVMSYLRSGYEAQRHGYDIVGYVSPG
ncbi:hypothetical protein P7C71_g3273, partial [Lecanoromycetidae sp. Uapishka_2]